jgi:DNA helicase-2/ATP-dependent DNA helicase PcrA
MAVEHMNGPALVVAGAGSGKTRVLTERVVRLIRKGVLPSQILAVTFTRKAASEMRTRVANRVGADVAKKVTISTFHSLALGIGREHSAAVFRRNSFSVWDDKTTTSELRRIAKDAWEDQATNSKPPAAELLYEVLEKHKQAAPARALDETFWVFVSETWCPQVSEILQEYERLKELANALDYDDLIWSAVRAFMAGPKLLLEYTERWHYLLIDEYQDTNDLQEQLVHQLAGTRNNVMAVGDEDQAIYAFRGSNPKHILTFEERYLGAKIVELTRNYRSSSSILTTAANVIANNEKRRPKNLRTDNEPGWSVECKGFDNLFDEARYIGRMIVGSLEARYPAEEHAVLVRTRRQLTALQMALTELGVPFATVGTLDFWQRVDVRLVLAWLKSLVNSRDLDAGAIMLSRWPRIGTKTIATWRDKAIVYSQYPMFFTLERLFHEKGCGQSTKKGQSLIEFIGVLSERDARMRRGDSIQELVLWFYEVTGVDAEIKNGLEGTGPEAEEALSRKLLKEQIVGMCPNEQGADGVARIEAFLDSVLMSAAQEPALSRVTLTTIHSAKGLEWDHVWVAGCVEGLLPYSNWTREKALAQLSPEDLEEERRLAYVAFTRARRRLVQTFFREMLVEGNPKSMVISRFLREGFVSAASRPTEIAEQDASIAEEAKKNASKFRTGVIRL